MKRRSGEEYHSGLKANVDEYRRCLERYGGKPLEDARQALFGAIEAESGKPSVLPAERLLVGNATAEQFWRGKTAHYDFIYSEVVFESIDASELQGLVQRMAESLTDDGIAFIRLMIFTGISGGQLIEWYPYTLSSDRERRSEPWEHLRQDRFPANTYLNRLTRRQYCELFAAHLTILEETVMEPDLGRRFLTPEIAEELKDYDDYELFSNSVLFVLGKQRQTGKRQP